ncbi:MAG: hypothetical protein P1V20_03125 [Verrucomicrobiales bacterium]|nr:hypothetical protein [Verrucomicrobiales bacterium]
MIPVPSKTTLFSLAVSLLLIAFSGLLPAVPGHASQAFVYPDHLHGRKLSNGEIFRHDRLTAGHATIPPGTVVRIVNLGNQMAIDVLINERWTGSSTGVILTRASASMLGMQPGARTMVNITLLSHPAARSQALPSIPPTRAEVPRPETGSQRKTVGPPSSPTGIYFLEFATYNNIVQAKMLSLKLTSKGAPSKVVEDQRGMYHVISDGFFTSLADASGAYHLVSRNVGHTPVIKKI